MTLFNATDRRLAEAINHLVYRNPFAPERIAAERDVLGKDFDESDVVWNATNFSIGERPNVVKVAAAVETFCSTLRDRLLAGVTLRGDEASLYEGVVMHLLYYRLHAVLEEMVSTARNGKKLRGVAEVFKSFKEDIRYFLEDVPLPGLKLDDPAHLFACFFQIRRAFDHIFRTIIGRSLVAAKLRASIWQSVFTHDLRRYRRTLYDKTGDFTTLIVGPSGTGKELVSRAIGASRYIPFDAKNCVFKEDFAGSFFALNLSALSPTLVESELFGHRRGAFTGAIHDKVGWLEICPPLGTVFLDEIGELDPAIQVKLLRVLQNRTFQRAGDTVSVPFRGKIIAATNRDLATEMNDGSFRRDLFYRLCSDIIVTPSLREQLSSGQNELSDLVRFLCRNILPDESDRLAEQVLDDIRKNLGPNYDWPGNFRELEQCVRNVLVRGSYRPLQALRDPSEEWNELMNSASLSADELLDRYCYHAYQSLGSYDATAKRLKLDRRTVKVRVERAKSCS